MSSSNSHNLSPAGVLDQTQWSELQKAIAPLSSGQLTWVSGYLAGLAQSHQPVAVVTQEAGQQPERKLTILYGSQTGNAKGVAEEYKDFVEQAGITAELFNMADYKPKKLKDESHVVIVVSTHGEGDAPDDAIELHEFLASKKVAKLPNLKYAVVGLGDSSYEFFCQTAKDFDQRLSALGASALTERLDCDVDYDTDVSNWREKVTELFKAELKSTSEARVVTMPGVNMAAATAQYNKKNPFTAVLLDGQKITGRDSVKDIRHFEISLEGSGLQYQPGDALGVWFNNDAAMVARLLKALELTGDEEIQVADDTLLLRQALIEKMELTQSYPSFAKAYAEATQSSELVQLLEDKAGLRQYLSQRQVVDIITEYPGKLQAQQLVAMLRPLTPRLYSIASSQAEVEDEVHLTVALVEYEAFGFTHRGGASGYLSHGVEESGEIRVFVERNDNFRLPENPDTPVIMIGPGTGIAPFRAFMQQREAEEADGRNWLFFGNPNFTQDFLYQVEWQRWVKTGLLNKVSLAFSRDQQEKIYVQHRLLEQGEEVYQWLEQGAHLYVCGDANRMAKDVHQALVNIVAEHGNQSVEKAEEYISQLRKAKRYQRDVY
ncbi:assimilatory sulfite reductase (NADPH) flavoprotein subunit [Lacimicrobium alkaliphilum]|uniref:Sulfite reductase [NADPH] flavoprotein alpha-component n=1 Tax=Lacimicrobium alkaliphilum TaxID=1526571 RepID=A0ABQ1RN03_9ALTE|nr:assimilatory sulfite reductase (NADPH) flavoprotein subunit [Lacimicrobium alkaliphilum]GGD72967.1 sulfite reductase [NADPH] flavoprotein alpha-component [Lacimicrobium alkaliphilum]